MVLPPTFLNAISNFSLDRIKHKLLKQRNKINKIYTVGCSRTVSFSCTSHMTVMYTDKKHNINGKLTTENIQEFFT